jgi:hypothetical protein
MLIAPTFRHVCSVLAGSGCDWNNTMVPRLGLIAQRFTGQWHARLCPLRLFTWQRSGIGTGGHAGLPAALQPGPYERSGS